jgi:hypothetical protein
MVSNFPRLLTTAGGFTSRTAQTPQTEGFGERVLDRVREAFCGLHGHDSMLQFEEDRMFLKCASCGHESPGWELNEPRPIVATSADNRRSPMVSREIDERRIA